MIKVYLAGGAGTIIGSLRPSIIPSWVGAHEVVYLDTSTSEASLIPKGSNVTIFNTPDQKAGSGGLRAKLVDSIKEQMPEFLVRNPPEDINIVVFSGSGASGSMLAYFLCDQLLRDGKRVIVLMSKASHNLVRTTNAMKSLLSLKSLVAKHKRSISMCAYDGSEIGYAQSDRFIMQDMLVLMYLFGGNIVGVDESDLVTLLSPEMLPDADLPPGIYGLSTIFGTEFGGPNAPAAILTLSGLGGTDDIGSGAPISFSGVIEPTLYKTIFPNADESDEAVLSMAVDGKQYAMWMNNLSKKAEGYKITLEASAAIPVKIAMPKGITLDTSGDGPVL